MRDRCVEPFRSRCDVAQLEICIAGCSAPRNECDKMACKLHCAYQQSNYFPECLRAFKDDCVSLNDPTTKTTTTTVMPEDGSFAVEEKTDMDKFVMYHDGGCNLDCSGALGLFGGLFSGGFGRVLLLCWAAVFSAV